MLPQNNSDDYQKVKDVFIAALDLEPEKRRAFLAEQRLDKKLLAEVESLLKAREEAGEFLNDVSAADTIRDSIEKTGSFIGRKIGNYRIEREIGRGGMGVVFLAEREDFHRQAAIKLIKRGMDSDAILERFTREREILAALNHPFIAHLDDGGTTDDDLPFFVMEYVEGVPVDEFCKNKNLSEKLTLELFRKICEAVSFAHQKLVIHRDLKLTNILVTENGTPKLLDFGIAKLLNATEPHETQTNMRVLTPAYASPEQIRGAAVDTTSDVYSLGVILYELLTKVRPYEFDYRQPEEFARIICDREPKKPSEALSLRLASQTSDDEIIINPKLLKGDLDNIVLKALQKDSARRYASVEQFSEDLRRYLAGLPVIARHDTSLYRMTKFIKRHKTGAASAAFILLTLLGGIAATGWEARCANLAQQRAERRFDDVRQLSNAMLFELNDEIEKGPTAARAMIVKKASEYLDKLSREAEDDVSLRLELVAAYIKVGDLQGRPFAPNLGETSTALESYQKAASLIESLRRSDAANPVFVRKFADVRQRAGEIHTVQMNGSAALEDFTELTRLREQTLAADPQNPDYRREAADAEMRMGDVLQFGSDETKIIEYPAVIERYERALAVFEDLAARQAAYCSKERFTAASIEQRIGLALNRFAQQTADIEKQHESINRYAHVLAVIEKFAAAEPNNLTYRRVLAGVRSSIADVQTAVGDYGEALANYLVTETMMETAAANDAANIEPRINLASLYVTYGAALGKSGDHRRAAEKLRRGIKISESLLPAAGTRVADIYPSLIDGYISLGAESEKTKDFAESLISYRKSLEYCDKFLLVDSLNQEFSQKKSLLLEKINSPRHALTGGSPH